MERPSLLVFHRDLGSGEGVVCCYVVGFGKVLGGVVLVVILIRISAEIPMYKGMGGYIRPMAWLICLKTRGASGDKSVDFENDGYDIWGRFIQGLEMLVLLWAAGV